MAANDYVTEEKALELGAAVAAALRSRAKATELWAQNVSGLRSAASTNLLNPAGMVRGYSVSASTGAPVVNEAYNLSDFLPILPSTTYSTRNVARWALYDAQRAFISTGTVAGFTAPANARYARLVVAPALAGQLSLGGVLPDYEPYWQTVSELRLPPVSVEDTNFVTRSTNLFDPAATITGYVLSAGTATPSARGDYSLSDPIPVKAGSVYSYRNLTRVTYLDAAGGYVGHVDSAVGGVVIAAAVPINATHVRISLVTSKVASSQMNAGSTILPFEPYWIRVGGRELPTPNVPATDLRYLIDAPEKLDQPYTSPTLDAAPGLESSTTADVYGWWDTLATAHPTYVTAENLGLSSDGVTQLRSYTLRAPTVPTALGATEAPIPAVLVIAGVHGYEKAAVYSAHAFAQALCEAWQSSPTLEALRWNVEFVFVPVANPHGYDASVRTNANGVDLARNFTAGWATSTPGTATYGGTAPLTEPESVILDTLMQAVASRCVLGVSLHTFSSPPDAPWKFLWNASATEMQLQLGKRVISMLSRKWRAEHAWITLTDTYFGSADRGAPPGSEGRQMASYGINGATFETSRLQRLDGGSAAIHESRALTLGVEAIVNYIGMGVRMGVAYANGTGRCRPGR